MKRKVVTLDAFFTPASKTAKSSSEPELLSFQTENGLVEVPCETQVSACSGGSVNHTKTPIQDISDFASLSSLTDEQKHSILTCDWSVPANFPLSKFGSKCRSFQASWLKSYPGLVYSEKTDGAFCKYCVAFGNSARGSLVKTPYRDWKDAKAKFNAHFCGVVPVGYSSKNGGKGHEAHRNCRVFSEEFLKKINSNTTIHVELNQALQDRMTNNVKVLESVVKTVLFCGRQNVALRGDRDDSKYLQTGINTGNFQALLDFRIDSGDDVLREHFKTSARNATYRSKTIQNEIIEIIGSSIQDSIVNEIQQAGGWFSVSADEVQDVANKEQLAICLRYANRSGEIQERLVAFQEVSGDTTGAALASEILNVIQNLKLDPHKMRSQCYDGAGNMMGHIRGVASRIQQMYPKALPFWCSSHLLNRCIVHACELKEVRNVMGLADKCVRFFNFSSKRQTALENELDNGQNSSKRTKLKEMCRTRWVERHDAFEVFIQMYPSIVDALSSILETEKRPDAVSDTSGILHAITTFQFVITLTTVLRCLAYVKPLSISLQGKTVDVINALKEVQTVQATIGDKRQNVDPFHAEIYQEAVTISEENGISVTLPRFCGRQTARNNTPANSPEEYYKRVVTIPFLDHLLQQMTERFSKLQQRAALALLLIPPISSEVDPSSLAHFTDDLPSPGTFQADLDCWKKKWSSAAKYPTTISDTLKECSSNMYPNIHTILRIAATFPVTSCECERSISTLGLVKTSLRSTMGQSRLTALCLMSVHRDIEVDVHEVVKTFSRRNKRKMKLPNILDSDAPNKEDYIQELWF